MLEWINDLLRAFEGRSITLPRDEIYTPPIDWTLAQQQQERWLESLQQIADVRACEHRQWILYLEQLAANDTPYARAYRYWWPWSEAFWK